MTDSYILSRLSKERLPEKIESFHPPVIVNTLSGRYAVFSGKWFPITEDVTIEDLNDIWEKEMFGDSPEEIHKVESSSGNQVYEVKRNGNEWSCTCLGYKFNKKCKHITKIKNQKS